MLHLSNANFFCIPFHVPMANSRTSPVLKLNVVPIFRPYNQQFELTTLEYQRRSRSLTIGGGEIHWPLPQFLCAFSFFDLQRIAKTYLPADRYPNSLPHRIHQTNIPRRHVHESRSSSQDSYEFLLPRPYPERDDAPQSSRLRGFRSALFSGQWDDCFFPYLSSGRRGE